MLKRFAALLMILLFAGQAMAGGIVCGIDAISKGLNRPSESGEATCPMEKSGACDDMACCRLGKSPTGAMGPMICCEVKCGESTGGAQFDFTPLNLAPAPSLIVVRLVSLDALSEAEASVAAASLRLAENDFLRHEPPSIFLQNSSFLI
jgi:hypothetical protein